MTTSPLKEADNDNNQNVRLFAALETAKIDSNFKTLI